MKQTDFVNEKAMEISGLLNMYLKLDNTVLNAKDGDCEIGIISTKEKINANDIFIDCLNELIESNPGILSKYNIKEIILNVHEVGVQEV